MIDYDKYKVFLYKGKLTKVYNKNNVNKCFNEFQKIISRVIGRLTISKVLISKRSHLKERMSDDLLCSTHHKQALSFKC